MSTTDSVDAVIEGWQQARPDLDVTPIGIVLRLGRIRALMEERMEALMASHGLTLADFSALAAVQRLQGERGVSQVMIMRELGLTSGTVSLRIDRLVKSGLATRATDPADRRGALVALTPAGRAAFDRAAPDHLANEAAMVSALPRRDQQHLAELLRALLAGLEQDS